MKQYEHKKTGRIVEKEGMDYVFINNRKIGIYKEIIEESNDWQEITKPEYTILRCKNKNGGAIHNHQSKENYTLISCEDKGCSIHSVRRESDGEVFTVGDKVQKGFEIYDIIINSDNKLLVGVRMYATRKELSELVKSKQPLFTTEDGVDIYVGDMIYWITFDWDTCCIQAAKDHTKEKDLEIECKGNFSTKEKAEEYIIRHKPCLSIAEVLKCLKISINSDEKKSLDRLAKQKLKQD